MQPIFFSNGKPNDNAIDDFNKYLYRFGNLLASPMLEPYLTPELTYRIEHQIQLLCVRINIFILECLVFGYDSELSESCSYTLIKYLNNNLKIITNNFKNNNPPKYPKIIDYMASTTWTVSIFSENLSNNLKFLKISPQNCGQTTYNNQRKSYHGTL